MSAPSPPPEMRLVLLGPADAERRAAAVRVLLGLKDEQLRGWDGHECTKHTGEVSGTQVTLISSPAWYSSACGPADRKRLLSSLISLSSPGPHAFLLCVTVNQPADGEAAALDALQQLFGSAAVAERSSVLFTNTEELWENERLEDYIVTWRKDLRDLVERCGDRYHTLETPGGESGESGGARELLEKLGEAGREAGAFGCSVYREAEDRVRERQRELLKRSGAVESRSRMQAVREEAERSVGEFDVEVESFFTPAAVCTPAPAPPASGVRGLWEKLAAWVGWLPSLVRIEALFGALVGLFVGGSVGAAVGATASSVATEVGRRKTQKTN